MEARLTAAEGLNPAQKLLLEAAACAARGERLRREAPVPEADWAALLPLAAAQKLLPLAAEALCELPEAAASPGFAALRGAARRQVLRQTQKDAAFLRLLRALREAELPVLTVKGCVCRRLYPNGALRISADEDLLTPPELAARTAALLQDCGFAPAEASQGKDPAVEETAWNGPEGLHIELHPSLFPQENGPFDHLETVFSGVFDRAVVYPLEDGTPVRSLSPQDHLLYLLLHAMKHFIRSGFGLRQLLDVGLWARRYGPELDWPLLLRQTRQVRAERFTAAVFALAEQYLGLTVELPSCWTELETDPLPLLLDLLDAGIYGSSTRSREHTARITQDAVAAQQSGKRGGLRTAVFPAARTLVEDYPVLRRHPSALPLVWGKRLVRYARRSRRAENPSETVKLGRQRLALLRQYGILE